MKSAPAQTPLAFSYVRFSSPAQAEGDSLRRQTERAAAYCARRGWRLSTDTYQDLGVSAFKGDNALVGNLGQFLKAVRSGKVGPGSVLVVESIDRISRQGIDEGYDLIKGILKAGVVLVTLSPEREFDAVATKSLSKGALEIQLILERAAEESERKADRLGAAWSGKRDRARKSGELLTHHVPKWIEVRDGVMHPHPERAEVVRRVFRMAAGGYGAKLIAGALVREGVPPMGNAGHWNASYIGVILKDRRAVGEFQPHFRGGAVAGDPIPGYFPAVVTEAEWLAARAGAVQRRQKPGRISADRHVNLFAGLLRDACSGSTYISRNNPPVRSTGKHQRTLTNRDGLEGRAKVRTFPYDALEAALLSRLRELDPRDVLPPAADTPDESVSLSGELAGVDAELAEALAFMGRNGFSATIGKRVTALEARRAEVTQALADAKVRAACPVAGAWRNAQTLMGMLADAPDATDARLRLRAALRRAVDSILVLIAPRGSRRLARVQVNFAGTDKQRMYLVAYQPKWSNGRGGSTPARWAVRSVAHPDDGLWPLMNDDLRDRDQANAALAGLEAYPRDILEELLRNGTPL